MSAVLVEGLVKRYGAVQAVSGASLDVEEGEIFALLGPNGAGKTTTLEIRAIRCWPTTGPGGMLAPHPR